MVCGPIHAQTGKYGWYITTRQSVSWFMQCVLVPAWTGKYEMKQYVCKFILSGKITNLAYTLLHCILYWNYA